MNTVKNILRSKKFWAAAALTGVTMSVILIQRRAPKIEVMIEDPADS